MTAAVLPAAQRALCLTLTRWEGASLRGLHAVSRSRMPTKIPAPPLPLPLRSYLPAFAFILLMVAAAVLFQDREIILPELAAMAVALWTWKDPQWMRHPEKIFLWPSLTALLGFAINLTQLPVSAKLALVLIGMLGLFAVLRYSLAPALATGFLPVVTNATHWSFMLAILVTTAVLAIGVVWRRPRGASRDAAPPQWPLLGFYALISAAWMGVALALGHAQLMVIPPLAVVVYESLHMKMYSARLLGKQVAVLSLSAGVGVLTAQWLESWLLIALLDLLLVHALLAIFRMRVPAVYAFPFLALVLPATALPVLPFATAFAGVLLLGAVLFWHRWRRVPGQR